ncbi:EAL domain-containing protein [Desulfurispora thermophila]|uniref:EAL domain-containing protein n=1 Tax=Desulfurispora thermophila TaxID=265470 RepID=UPI00035E4BC2|nr:EAL domain-containing protein [Desulfurispora thermophila]
MLRKSRWPARVSSWPVLSAFLLLFLLVCLAYSQRLSDEFYQLVLRQRQHELQEKVDLAYNAISPLVEKCRRGELTVAQARQQIRELVRRMRYEDEFGKNYIFMSTYDGIYLVQPYEPQNEGKNMWDYRDIKGTYVIRELVRAARQNPGGTYVSYYSYRPFTRTYEPKLSYVRGIPEIEAYIGTGVYMQSTFRQMLALLARQRLLGLVMALGVALLSGLYILQLRRVQKQLQQELAIKNQLYQENEAAREEIQAQYEEIAAQYEENRQLLEEQARYQSYIEHMAYHDPLTGLANRRRFEESLARELERPVGGAVLLLDLDNFKHINDSRGHIYGDVILQKVAALLQLVAGPDGLVARFGGDEFLLLWPGIGEEQEVRERAVALQGRLTAGIYQSEGLHLTASVGVALYPAHGDDVTTLVRHADTALFAAKKSGKNACLFFCRQMTVQLEERLALEELLRRALQQNGFVLHYQPLVDLRTGRVAALEALLRLPGHNVSPAQFIPLAEESGLIREIGRWVLDEAIRQMACWRQAGCAPGLVCVNVSPRQLQQGDFVEQLTRLLQEHRLPPACLELEITENVFLEQQAVVLENLHRLQQLGVSIALDDFGKGYSALNYLTFVPVQKIKLDKSLCDRFLLPDRQPVFDSLLALAHSLHLEVVAEGIEEAAVLNLARQSGCDYAQGFLFSRPLPCEQVEFLLAFDFSPLFSGTGH